MVNNDDLNELLQKAIDLCKEQSSSKVNWLQNLIDSVFQDKDQYYIHMSKAQSLYELRTLYAIGPRQTGATTCVAEIFNPEYDIYFGNNPAMVNRFKEITGYRNIMYSYLNQKSHDNLRGRKFNNDNLMGRKSNVRYIFIDLSNIYNMYDSDTQQKINKFIEFCELSFDSPKYIFT